MKNKLFITLALALTGLAIKSLNAMDLKNQQQTDKYLNNSQIECCEMLVEAANIAILKNQPKTVITLIGISKREGCLFKTYMVPHEIVCLIGKYSLHLAKNKQNPQSPTVLAELQKIEIVSLKQYLVSKYFPSNSNDGK